MSIADDEPASFGALVRYLAAAIGAPPPPTIPRWTMRVLAPFAVAAWTDTTIRVSNRRAKAELGWLPRFPSYRDGIADAVARGAVRQP